MATITIRDLDDGVRTRIQVAAAHHGRSMEAEVRNMLSQFYGRVPLGDTLLKAAEEFRRETGGVDLELPQRHPARIPDLSGGRS